MKKNSDLQVPSRYEFTMQLLHLGSYSSTLRDKAYCYKKNGDLNSAKRWFDRSIALDKKRLQTALLNNQHHPESPQDTSSIISPLLGTLIVQSDTLQFISNTHLQQAEELRNEARDLCNQYLSPCDCADIERTIATSLITQGRFNEALEALEKSRDTLQDKCDDVIKLSKTTIDLAGIREWLGDDTRALSDLERAEKIMASKLQGRTIPQLNLAAVTSHVI
jgi:tetratricopeptide (TPR) repeat protein